MNIGHADSVGYDSIFGEGWDGVHLIGNMDSGVRTCSVIKYGVPVDS